MRIIFTIWLLNFQTAIMYVKYACFEKYNCMLIFIYLFIFSYWEKPNLNKVWPSKSWSKHSIHPQKLPNHKWEFNLKQSLPLTPAHFHFMWNCIYNLLLLLHTSTLLCSILKETSYFLSSKKDDLLSISKIYHGPKFDF